jgi:phage-related protein
MRQVSGALVARKSRNSCEKRDRKRAPNRPAIAAAICHTAYLDSMSHLTYILLPVSPKDKPLVWFHGEVKSPPFSKEARLETGYPLRLLQHGESIGMPHSRPMPSIGPRCHELRVPDKSARWRIMYRIDSDAIALIEVFSKKSGKTPKHVIEVCKHRLKDYDSE